jgi:hypothetical protein
MFLLKAGYLKNVVILLMILFPEDETSGVVFF